MMICDLHTHSNYSDGTYSPSELVAEAEQKGISAIALTDHNTVRGLPEFVEAGKNSPVETVPGCEFSTLYRTTELHIVGLFLRESVWNTVEEYVGQTKKHKDESNRTLIRNLQKGGYDITFEEASAKTRSELFNRAHVAELLYLKGYVKSIQEAFDSLLKEGGGFYIPPKRLDVFETIAFIKSVGGVAVHAHPFLDLKENELEEFLPLAKARGLDAIETRYSEFDAETTEAAVRLAERFGLKQSGGSDFHGSRKPAISMGTGKGSLCVPFKFIKELRNCCRTD